MVSFKNYRIGLYLAVIIGFATALFYALLEYFYHNTPFRDISLEMLMLLFFCVSGFCFLLLHFRIERFILKKVKEIYRDLSPAGFLFNQTTMKADVESLTKSLQKFASDRKLEIQGLKEQENYRKEFIGNISHELKTPLFTIQGYVLTLLDGGALDDKKTAKKYLKRTAKGVDRLIYIIKDLDLITKFEAGIESIAMKSFDITETIRNVFELLEMEAAKNKIQLAFDKEYETPIYVEGDEERIQQVLTNLIMNSLKYGVEKGTTELSIQDLNEKKILIRITDNGEGIEKEHLPRLFERFYRVDKTGNRKDGGSGLGLAIVKHIIEAHQEKVFVESEVGIGSEFSFTMTKS